MENPEFTGVRFAVPADEDGLFEILTLAHADNGLFTMDEGKVRDMIRRATERTGGMIGVIAGPERIEGVIMMIMSNYWYTNDTHLEELANFVHPLHRRSTHAKRLLEFAKWCQRGLSKDINIPLLVGILTLHKLEPKMRLYQRMLPQVGAVFQCGLDVPDAFNQRKLNDDVRGAA